MNLARNWLLVREVISSTESGASVMSALPDLVRQLVEEQAWRDFVAPSPVGHVHHDTFGDFVRDHPPRGLDSRVDQMLALCGGDEDLITKVRRLIYAELPAAMTPGGDRRSTSYQVMTHDLKRESAHTIARLKRDDPELANRVVQGELTPYQAQREKGWKAPRIYLTNPERVANSLQKYMKPDDIAKLIALLLGREA